MKEKYSLYIKTDKDCKFFNDFVLFDVKNHTRYHGIDYIKDYNSFLFEGDERFMNSLEITKKQFKEFLNFQFGTTLTVESFKKSNPEFFI